MRRLAHLCVLLLVALLASGQVSGLRFRVPTEPIKGVIDSSNIREAFEQLKEKAGEAMAAVSHVAQIDEPDAPPHIRPVGPEVPMEPAQPDIHPVGPEQPDVSPSPPDIRPVGPERPDIAPLPPHIRPVGPEQPHPDHDSDSGASPHIQPVGPEKPADEPAPHIHPIGPEQPSEPEEPRIRPVGPERRGPMLGEGGEKLPYNLMPEPMPMPMPMPLDDEEGPFGGLFARLIGGLNFDFGGELNAPPSFPFEEETGEEGGHVETSTTKLPGGGLMIVRRFRSGGQAGDKQQEDAPPALMTPPSPLFGSFLPSWLRRPMPLPVSSPVFEPEISLRQQEHIKMHFGGDEDRGHGEAEQAEAETEEQVVEEEAPRHKHRHRHGCKHRKHKGGLLNRIRGMFRSRHGEGHHEHRHHHKRHHHGHHHKRHHREEEEQAEEEAEMVMEAEEADVDEVGEGFVRPEWAGTADIDEQEQQQVVEAEIIGEEAREGDVADSILIASMADASVGDELLAPADGRRRGRNSFARFIHRRRVALAVSVSLAGLLLVLLAVLVVRRRAALKAAAAANPQVAMMPPPATMHAYVPLAADAPSAPLVVQ